MYRFMVAFINFWAAFYVIPPYFSHCSYSDLSKYTHRTYNSLTKSYILGRQNKIAYDGFSEGGFRVLPHVISFSYAAIAVLIKRFVDIAISTQELQETEAATMWGECLEKETVRRHFGTGPGQIMRGPPMEIE